MTTSHHHEKRVQTVLAAIAEALEAGSELPDLAELAARAHFSPFHFHRVWRALTGEPVGATVLHLRLRRAIDLLADESKTVTDVAMAVGLGSSQALARLVREHLATTPTALRDAGTRAAVLQRMDARRPMPGHSPCHVDVVTLAPFRAMLQRVTGGDDAVAAAYAALFEAAAGAGLLERVAGLWGIEHDDRRDVPEAECRADCLLAMDGDDALPVDLSTATHGSGRFARVRVTGAFNGIEPAIDAVLAAWLPSSGAALRDAPILLHYLDDPETTPEATLRTDVYVPLAD